MFKLDGGDSSRGNLSNYFFILTPIAWTMLLLCKLGCNLFCNMQKLDEWFTNASSDIFQVGSFAIGNYFADERLSAAGDIAYCETLRTSGQTLHWKQHNNLFWSTFRGWMFHAFVFPCWNVCRMLVIWRYAFHVIISKSAVFNRVFEPIIY